MRAKRPADRGGWPLLCCREVDEHNILGHSHYRSWCPPCVVGRGVGQRHVASEEESGALPMIVIDCGFWKGVGLGAKSEARQATGAAVENTLRIFVMKDKRSKTLSASFVLAKGADGFAVKFAAALMDHMLGHEKVVNRSDGEHSIVLLKKSCGEACSGGDSS